jgi:hypothetical protein
MAWLLLCFDVLPTIEAREGTHAMRQAHKNQTGQPWHKAGHDGVRLQAD